MSINSGTSVSAGGPGTITWQPWGEAAFAEAAAAGRPVLLNLSASWCHWCRRMAEGAWSDAAVNDLVSREFVPVRVDADRDPHVQDRYIAGGWPTTAFLTPNGEVLWAGTYMEAPDLLNVAASVLSAWRERRDELEREIGRRTRAMQTARARSVPGGLVRREPADDVLTAARESFDPRHGGFGGAPKFPHPEAVELLYAHAAEDEACLRMADLTLDGMLAGDLWDAVAGGFFRYAMAADWTEPRYEKLLDVNAALLEAYAVGARLRDREDWRGVAERTVAWVDAALATGEGLWAGSQAADPEYYQEREGGRALLAPPDVDPTVFTQANARWIGALAIAGARLDRPAWTEAAAAALRTLLALMRAPNGGLYHYRAAGEEPRHDFLLVDTLETARAALSLAQATGEWDWITVARRLAQHIETRFWAEDGGFRERIVDGTEIGALRYVDCAFETNAVAARLLLDLAQVTGERHWRALAERTLARISARAGRYGAAAATFALATGEFFEPAPAVFIALPGPASAGDALKRAAFSLQVPSLRVWSVPAGHNAGHERFDADDVPLAYLRSHRGRSAAYATPEHLAAAVPVR